MPGGSSALRQEPRNPGHPLTVQMRGWSREGPALRPGTPIPGRLSFSIAHPLLSLLAASFFSKGQRVKGVDTPSLWDSRTFFGRPRRPSSSFRVFIWDMGAHPNSITPTATQESHGERAPELQLDPSSHLLLRTQVGRGDEE